MGRRSAKTFILSSILIFLFANTLFCALFYVLESFDRDYLKFFASSEPLCKNIRTVSTNKDVYIVEFRNSIAEIEDSRILASFGLRTSWSNKKIEFPPGSGSILSKNQTFVHLHFYLPVIDTYNTELFCSNPKYKVSEKNTLYKSFHRIQVTNFSADSDFTRLKCHNDNWKTRWCEAKTLAYVDGLFCFFSPAVFSFPSPFLVPGPRLPPLAKEMDDFLVEPVVINTKRSQAPFPLHPVTSPAFIYGTFHNYFMLWHFVFDFVIPFYQFHRNYNFTDSVNERVIYIKTDGVWRYEFIGKALSTNPIQRLSTIHANLLFHNAVLGIEKPEKYVEDLNIDNFKYTFTKESVKNLRESLIGKDTKPGAYGRPMIVLIDRRDSMRNINNIEALFNKTKELCNFCHVKKIDLRQLPSEKQVELASISSILVGLHGSGLTHVLWMRPSSNKSKTHLIEVLPHGYTCRDWYELAANISQVKYHSIQGVLSIPSNISDTQKACLIGALPCSSLFCHDFLRDQTTSVNVTEYEDLIKPLIEDFRSQTFSEQAFSF